MHLTHVKAVLQNHEPNLLARTEPAAAVMVLLLTDSNAPLEIVLTERALTLPTYAGQISFPGGRQDTTDEDLYQTAQRELHEELHISPGSYEHIGQLDDFQDRYGHLVRPFVCSAAKATYLTQLQPKPSEIARVLYFPLNNLALFENNPLLAQLTRRSPSYSLEWDGALIWGLTAMILVHFFNLLQACDRPLAKKPRP